MAAISFETIIITVLVVERQYSPQTVAEIE